VMALSLPGQVPSFFKHGSDDQLEWVSPIATWTAEEADCRIAVGADTNTRELSGVPPRAATKRRSATRHLLETTDAPLAEGEHRWVYTLVSNAGLRRRRGDESGGLRGFLLHACLADDPDHWEPGSVLQRSASAWPSDPGHEEVRVTAPGTDVTLGVAGRKFSPPTAPTTCRMGSFFTAPLETPWRARCPSTCRAIVGGRQVVGVKLRLRRERWWCERRRGEST